MFGQRRKLRVIHRPPGYEAWKDEKPISKANLKIILIILGSVFGCGVLSASGFFGYFAIRSGSGVEPLPTMVTMDMLITPTATERYNVVVMDQVAATATLVPTETPIPATPDLQATLHFMLTEQALTTVTVAKSPVVTPESTIAVATSEPIFCEGAPFDSYQVGMMMRVTFEDKGALRLLDRPRLPDTPAPKVLKQLYDNDTVIVIGDAVCGSWNGSPVAYYPVEVPRWSRSGFVGFGQSGDVWLEAIG